MSRKLTGEQLFRFKLDEIKPGFNVDAIIHGIHEENNDKIDALDDSNDPFDSSYEFQYKDNSILVYGEFHKIYTGEYIDEDEEKEKYSIKFYIDCVDVFSENGFTHHKIDVWID